MKKNKTYTATTAKNRFGEVLENAQRESVFIEKSGRTSAVIISFEKYNDLMGLENSYWALKAEQAKAQGFIGEDDSEKLLEDLLNAKS